MSLHNGTPESLPRDYAILSRYAAALANEEENQPNDNIDDTVDDAIDVRHAADHVHEPTARRSSFPSSYIHIPPANAAMGILPDKSTSFAHALPSETTPLLAPPMPRIEEDVDRRLDEDDNNIVRMYWEELAILTKYTLPVFGTHILEYSFLMASVVSIGHLSTTALAAATLGSMTASVTGLSIIQGFASTLDTMLPGAWTSSQPNLVGLWSQRMTFVMALILIPILAIWFNAEPILLLLKQEPEVAQLAGVYLKWTAIGLPAYAFNCISRRYLQSQGLFHAPTRISLMVAPINVFLNYLLVWGPKPLRLGFIGAPLATSISLNLVAISSIVYGIFFVPRTAWHPINRKMFTNLGVLVQLGLAGVGQTASEWWSWELIGLAASFLGPVALATQSVLLVSASTTFQAPFALSVAVSVRIGNLLGEAKARRAGVSAKVSIFIGIVIAAVWSTLFLTFRNTWAYIFNDDPDVVSLVASIMPIVALFQVFDGTAAVTGGILRARGRQFTGALLNLSAYYVIGIPLGVWLTFRRDMKLLGLWVGLTISLVYCAFWGVYLTLRTDWEKEVRKLAERLASERKIGTDDVEHAHEPDLI